MTRPNIQRVADLLKLATDSLGIKVEIKVKVDDVPTSTVTLDGWITIFPMDYEQEVKSLLGKKTVIVEGYRVDKSIVRHSISEPDDVDVIEHGDYPSVYRAVEEAIMLLVETHLDNVLTTESEAEFHREEDKAWGEIKTDHDAACERMGM